VKQQAGRDPGGFNSCLFFNVHGKGQIAGGDHPGAMPRTWQEGCKKGKGVILHSKNLKMYNIFSTRSSISDWPWGTFRMVLQQDGYNAPIN